VPGIGGYFARQVDRYRQRLGGFYSVQQLKEIEDFPESALTYFIIEGEIRKLKVNQMTLNELRKHPYINYYQARAILTHRRLRGPLSSLDDLRLLKEFTPHDLERLRPYVEF
jgi:DNA uptake protein ComE-like DNA-binding protein